jgi:uncharacterized protein YgbK (DUF1537 family)
MIVVIADDFTGAAELGAIGLRYGLNVEVQTRFNSDSKADIIILDTDTRSRTPVEAATEVKRVARGLRKIPVEWVYKKVDSVMRGHVLAELNALLVVLNGRRTLLIPANPSLGRTISHGRYFIDGRLLSETDFSSDPEYPATSSDVLELLGPSRSMMTCVLQHHQPLPDRAIVVGEAESREDLSAWAMRLDPQTIPAGGAEFFTAILEAKGFRVKPHVAQDEPLLRSTALFVCGSSSDYSRKAVEEAEGRGAPVSRMPPELFRGDNPRGEFLQIWIDNTLAAFERGSRVIVAIGQPVVRDPVLARRLRHHMAVLVERVLDRVSIDELYIEGGATASAIARRLGWRRFHPYRELAPGVVRMHVEGRGRQHLTVKPGSYPWPEEIWRTSPSSSILT